MKKPVILTGLRANNDLHIGNYLGALLPVSDMATQKSGQYQVNLFVPDLHSFTTPIDHRNLQKQILHNLKLFVAAGLPIDNDDVYIYRQSHIPAHSELTWILDCFTSFGEMRRMTQFKDKSGLNSEASKSLPKVRSLELNINKTSKSELLKTLKLYEASLRNNGGAEPRKEESISVGLFNYPVLMAADILLYHATYVPVGDDQKQHLEFTRDIAERMNTRFNKKLFTVPLEVRSQHAFFGKDQGLRVRDLVDPTKKMSKSDASGKGVIFLGDTPSTAKKKIMSATTDSLGRVGYNYAERPGISNLLDLLALLSGRPIGEVCSEYVGRSSYGELKSAVAEITAEFLVKFQKSVASIDEEKLLKKLSSSEEAMKKTANDTLFRVQQAVGLRAAGLNE
jgi:tryptophanyl-tRNA synthetase